jgi:hypothetical protein
MIQVVEGDRMKQAHHNRNFFSHAMALLLITACVIPGVVSPTAPTANPDALSTIIAGTAAAAAAQTAGVPAGALATDPPAAEGSAGATPGMSGTNVEKFSDGTTRYTDYDGGFEMTFPAGWLVVRPNTDEFNAALANEGAKNQLLRDQMTLDQTSYEADARRLFSYTLRPDIERNTLFGFSRLALDLENTNPLDNYALSQLVTSLESSGAIPGYRIVVAQLNETGNGVTVIEIGGPYSADDGQGGKIPFYATILFFKPTSGSLARLTFTILQEYQGLISADIRSVSESIRLLGQ